MIHGHDCWSSSMMGTRTSRPRSPPVRTGERVSTTSSPASGTARSYQVGLKSLAFPGGVGVHEHQAGRIDDASVQPGRVLLERPIPVFAEKALVAKDLIELLLVTGQ